MRSDLVQSDFERTSPMKYFKKSILIAMFALLITGMLGSTSAIYAKSKKKAKYKSIVTLAHATVGEKGKIYGAKPGDQTGKEVTMTGYAYNKKGGWSHWTFVARPKNPALAKAMAKMAIKGCNNKNIGYGKNGPYLSEAAEEVGYDLSKINTPVNCDCISFVYCCRASVGLTDSLTENESFSILTDPEFITKQDNLQVGDILVTAGKTRHICIVCKVKRMKVS